MARRPLVLKLRRSFKNTVLLAVSAFLILFVTGGMNTLDLAQPVIWKFNKLNRIGKYKPMVLGDPVVIREVTGRSMLFNGVNDGIIVPGIPFEGWSRFTIEVLCKPDGSGGSAPRFFHFQDGEQNRGTLELRLIPGKQWYLDAFLKSGKTGKEDKALILADTAKVYPTDRWYWVAMVYNGRRMSSYVNGLKQQEGDVKFPVMGPGNISIGVRLNKVFWYKGSIREVRFHSAALEPGNLKIFPDAGNE